MSASPGEFLSQRRQQQSIDNTKASRTVRRVISSREKAPTYGPGHLLVDGTDTELFRWAEISIRPTQAQSGGLNRLLAACCEVYNAALQERRDAYRMTGRSISVFEQFAQIKDLHGVRDDVLIWGVQPVRSAIRRIDEAFAGFFRRCANGQTPGFPRFKSVQRYNTVSWNEPKCWGLDLDQRQLYVQGIGTINLSKSAVRQLKRLADRGGEPRTLTITRKRAGSGWVWRATVGFRNVAALRTEPAEGSDSIVGGDRGINVALATSDGTLFKMPRYMGRVRDQIAELQRQQATKQLHSRAWRDLQRRINWLYAKARNQRDNWARETANTVVRQHAVIVLEDLKLVQMSKSAKGTVEDPGTNVAAKAGLNRELRDAALGRMRHWIGVKAEEAGCRLWVVPPQNTSRTCSACGHCSAKNRNGVRFQCLSCGHEAHADTNASEIIGARGQVAEAAWHAAGCPLLARPKPKLRRRKTDEVPALARAA